MTQKSLDRDALWAEILEIYAAPGVQPACLHFQDSYGVDITLLLFSLALGRSGRQPLNGSELQEADRLVAHWRATVIQPLRGVRQTLKGGVDTMPLPRTEPLRDVIKRAELTAEEIEFDVLATHYATRPAHRTGGGWAIPALEAALAHFGGLSTGTAQTADAIAALASAAEVTRRSMP